MEKDILVPILLFVGILLIIIIYNHIQNRNYKLELLKDIEKKFGENYRNVFAYKEDELYKILGGNIDDLVYSDFNLDEFYKKYNHTKSTVGSHYLYYLLRNTKNSKDEIEKIQKRRQDILENVNLAKKIQFELAKLGFFKDSVIDLLYGEIEIDSILKKLTYVFSLTPLFLVVGFIIFKQVFVPMAIMLIISNVLIYQSLKKVTYGKINSLFNLQSILKTSIELEKLNSSIFAEYNIKLMELNKKVSPLYKKIKGFSLLSGNPELDFAKIYMNTLFLSEGRRLIKSDKYIKIYEKEILSIYEIIGKIDTELAMASVYIANDLKDASFIENGIVGKNLNNPFLEKSISNDIELTEKSILLTGSNASGKSTYLRTVGINLLLAQSAGFVFADEFKTELINIKSAISISDSILENRSYFMTEAQVIKNMIDSENRQFILLDEIFRGTNTIDRVSVATSTLEYLSKNNLVISATHDIELTKNLENIFENYHFEESVIDGDLTFDYKIKKGPAISRNATLILETLNYPEIIIKKARNIAINMEKKELFNN